MPTFLFTGYVCMFGAKSTCMHALLCISDFSHALYIAQGGISSISFSSLFPPPQTPPISGWCPKSFGLRARRPLKPAELSASRHSRTSGVDPQQQQNLCPHFSSPDRPSDGEAPHSIPGEVEEDQPLGSFKSSLKSLTCRYQYVLQKTGLCAKSCLS